MLATVGILLLVYTTVVLVYLCIMYYVIYVNVNVNRLYINISEKVLQEYL